MSLIDDELDRAETNATDARKHLAETVAALHARLKPRSLVRHAVHALKEAASELGETSVDTVKRNPVPTLGVIAAITAFIARKPIARLFQRSGSAK